MHNQVTRLVIDELREQGSARELPAESVFFKIVPEPHLSLSLTLWTQHMKVDWQIKQEQE